MVNMNFGLGFLGIGGCKQLNWWVVKTLRSTEGNER